MPAIGIGLGLGWVPQSAVSAGDQVTVGYGGNPYASLFNSGTVDPLDATLATSTAWMLIQNRWVHRALAICADGSLLVSVYLSESATLDDRNRGLLQRRTVGTNFDSWRSWELFFWLSDYVASTKYVQDGPYFINPQTGRVYKFFCYISSADNTWHLCMAYSDSHGAKGTWKYSTGGATFVHNGAASTLANAYVTTAIQPATSKWWVVTGGHFHQFGSKAGQLYLVGSARTTLDNTGAAWNWSAWMVDNGDGTFSFTASGGNDPAAAPIIAANPSEIDTCEITANQSGDMLAVVRANGASARKYLNLIHITDDGATWADPVALDGTGGKPTLYSIRCYRSIWTDKLSGDQLITGPSGDVSDQSNMRLGLGVFRNPAANLGADTGWGNYRPLFRGASGYSGIVQTPSGMFVVVSDCSYDPYNFGGGSWTNPQFSTLFRFNRNYLLGSTLGVLPRVHLFFNDGVAGSATIAGVGSQLLDHATGTRPAVGGSGATFATSATRGTVVSFAASGNPIVLQLAQPPVGYGSVNSTGGDWDVGSGSFTWEWDLSPPVSAASELALCSTGVGATGWRLTWTTAVKPKFVLRDNSAHSVSITADNALQGDGSGDDWHRLAVVYDRTAALLRMYVDGVEAATPVSTATLVGNMVALTAVCLGADTSTGTVGLTFKVAQMRGTPKALLAGELLTGNEVRESAEALRGFTPATPAEPSGLVLDIFPTWNAGRSLSTDFYRTIPPPYPLEQGRGIQSQFSLVDGQTLWSVKNTGRTTFLDYDSDVGWHYRLGFHSFSLGANWRTAVTNTFDFVQDTGLFTMMFGLKIVASTGQLQDIWSNLQPGFRVFWGGNGDWLGLVIHDGVIALFSNDRLGTVTAAKLLVGNWYAVAIRGNGFGVAPDLRKGQITGLAAPAMTTYTAGTTITSTTPPHTSTSEPAIGCAAPTPNYFANIRLKNFKMFNRALSDAEVDAEAARMVLVPA